MAFWGIEVKPNKPASLNLMRRLVIKQVALVVLKPSKKSEPCTLSIEVADDPQRYVLCRLHEGVFEQCAMEMPFSPGDEAKVHLTGAHAVHLTGFLDLDDEDDLEDMDDLDELEEEDEPVPAGKKPASGKAATGANVGKGKTKPVPVAKSVPEDMQDSDEEEGEEDSEDEDGEEEDSLDELDGEESDEEEEEVELPKGKRAAPAPATPQSAKKAKPTAAKPATPAAAKPATPAAGTPGR